MLIDDDGVVLKIKERATIDLLTEKSLFIKNAIDPKEFSGDD
jgi:hypothetical protein